MTISTLTALWNQAADVWGAAMLRALVQGGIAALVVGAFCIAFPKTPPFARTWLWRFACLKMLIAFCCSSAIDVPLLPLRARAVPQVFTRPAPISAAYRPIEGNSRVTPDVLSVSAAPLPSEPLSLPGLLMMVWLAGTIWQTIRLAGEVHASAWLRRLSEPIRDDAYLACSLELCDRMNIQHIPELLVVEGAGSPMLTGVRAPAVLFPSLTLRRYGLADFELMLAHELAHWKRRDLLWGWLPACCHLLFYFYPIQWLAERETRLSQEIACDAMALETLQASAGRYARTLLDIAAGQRERPASRMATVGAVETAADLKRRLNAMKHFLPNSHGRAALTAGVLAIAGAAAMLPWHFTAAGASTDVRPDVRPGIRHKEADPGVLKYRWQAGKSYAYSVHIEADAASSVDTENGTVTYTVASANGDGTTLTCRGRLIPMSRSKASRFAGIPRPPMFNRFRFGGMPSPFAAPNEVKIDSYGQVLSARGDSPLPRALGELTLLVIDPLPRDNEADWQTSAGCTILLTEVHRISPLSSFGREETTRLPAQEQTHYTAVDGKGAQKIIKKHYQLRTSETVEGEPRIEIVGDGEITFDTEAGIPRAMTFKATLTERPNANTTLKTPITLTYQLLEGQAAPAPGNPNAIAPVNPPVIPKPALQQASDAEIAQALSDLKAEDGFKRSAGIRKLESAEPGGNRRAVVAALTDFLGDKDSFNRCSAVKALVNWGGKDAVPVLVKQLDDDAFNVRWADFDALGLLKDRRGAEAVARWLKKDRGFASRSLQAMGPVAEPSVVKYLQDDDDFVRMEACNILKVVGTKSSLPVLQRLAAQQNGLTPHAAKEAATAIQSR